MRKFQIAALALLALFANSCKHEPSQSGSVSYPAAYIVNTSSNSISVINTNTGTVADSIMLSNAIAPYHIYISPDKKLLAVSVVNHNLSAGFPTANFDSYNSGNKVLIIDALSKKVVKEIALTRLASNAIFSFDGTELWIAQAEDVQSKIVIYNVSDWTLKTTIPLTKGLSEITFCSDGDMSFTCTSGDDSVQMYYANSKNFLMNTYLPVHPIGAFPSDHHTDFVICDGNNTVFEVDASTCLVMDTVIPGFKPGFIKYNSAKSEMWMSDVSNGKVHWFKSVSSQWVEQGAISVGTNPRWIAFNTDESLAYVANQNSNTVSIVNASSHTVTNTIVVGNSPASIAIKP